MSAPVAAPISAFLSARRLTRRRFRRLLLATVGAVAGGAAPALAAPPDDGGIEQITVTAERRTQNVQDIGSSISVISEQSLVDHNVNDLYDLQYLTPSLQVTPQFGSGQYSFTIRGMGFNDYASNNTPTVGLYVDEVAYPVPFGANGLLFDARRVEVLRGPQGTLYGRNTTAGAVNFVLNKPTRDYEGGFSAQYGSFNADKVNGYVSGPLTDTLRFRLAGESEGGGAWQTRADGAQLGDVDRKALRLLLDLDATDTLKLELNLHGSRDRSDANGLYLYRPLTALNAFFPGQYPVYPAATGRTQTSWGTSADFAREIGISPDSKPFSHIDTSGFSLRAEQELGVGTLTDLVSYDYSGRREYDNYDAFAGGVADVYYNTRANVLSNELRLTSDNDRRLTWIVGTYYSHQYLKDNYRSGFMQIYALDADVRYSQTADTVSGFGQATYKVTDDLRLTAGFRLEHEERDLNDFASYFLAGGVITNPGNSVGPQSTSYTEPSGKAEVQYDLLPNDMAYASFSRGVKSGGFTTYNSTSPTTSTAPFRPETVLAYEIGNKLDLPERHLRLNVSAFYYDYHDQQIQSATVNPQTGLVGAIVNAPRSHLYGGEFEGTWTPVDGLTVTQGVGWSQGSFDEFRSVLSAVRVNGVYVGVYGDRKGVTLPAPKVTLNGSVSYTARVRGFELVPEVDYSYRSDYNSLFGSLYNVGGYALVNAGLTFRPEDDRWSLTAFGQNILNRGYDIMRNYFVEGDDVALAGHPATWGVRVSARF